MADTPNMADLFGKMQEMQTKMAEAQEALGKKTVIAEAGGGMVQVTANGHGRVTAIKLEKTVVNPDDVEMLEDLVMAGVNKAMDEAERMRQAETQRGLSGLMPPGLDLGSLGG